MPGVTTIGLTATGGGTTGVDATGVISGEDATSDGEDRQVHLPGMDRATTHQKYHRPAPWVNKVLAHHALTIDIARHPVQTQFWRTYKRDPHFASWLNQASEVQPKNTDGLARLLLEYSKSDVDSKESISPSRVSLVDDTIYHLATHASDMQVVSAFYLATGIDPSKYEERMIGLREGDTVVFSDKEFVLGAFLGAGNATHVYAIHGQPDKVLRIPFLVPCVAANMITQGGFNLVQASRHVMHNHATVRPEERDDIRVVTILLGPNNEYAISERVHGKENGRDFIFRMAAHVAQNGAGLGGFRLDEALHLMGDIDNNMKYRRLTLAIDYERYTRSTRSPVNLLARQYVWDENEHNWVLVDWDDD